MPVRPGEDPAGRNCHPGAILIEWRPRSPMAPSEIEMRLSRYFLPLLKETPAEAQIVSHQLMLRAGMIRQSSAGIYSWLPLGLRVLRRVEQIVREEMDAAGCHEILMPAIQPAELWQESGRYEDYGKEMLRITDRHERPMLYGPTHEEVVTDIFRRSVRSYRDLPVNLYQIQWKFRDEIRPRFGVMRGREFYMKDNYSFDLDFAGAMRSYDNMFIAYLRTFRRMGLTAIPMRAASGAIGGNLSHEFQVLAATGESQVYYDAAFEAIDLRQDRAGCRAAEVALCRDRRAARPGDLPGARGAAALGARHRGRPDLLLRHQILEDHGRDGDGPGRPGDAGRDGLLRHRRLTPGRRTDRGLPRRGRDQVARAGGTLPARRDQSASGRSAPATTLPPGSRPSSPGPASRSWSTTAKRALAPSSPPWT